jgi:hypothetical protein
MLKTIIGFNIDLKKSNNVRSFKNAYFKAISIYPIHILQELKIAHCHTRPSS